ncbi:MAG: hypothetical protein KAI66_21785 [Lentisphaeria bacterium]|nr:hypothetical protein [Lentisphaeria bacterium]
MQNALCRIVVLSVVLGCLVASAEVKLDWKRATLTVADDGTAVSLVHKADARECLAPSSKVRFAKVRLRSGKGIQANAAKSIPGGFELRFPSIDTVLVYGVDATEDWLRLTLERVEGTRPASIELISLRCSVNGTVGRRLNAAYDETTTVCLLAAGTQVNCGAKGSKTPLLRVTTQDAPGPKLEGASAALVVCPTAEFKAIARKASHAFGMPINEDASGTPVKDTDLVRGSYFFIGFGAAEADKMIDYCRKAGIQQVMLSSGAWTRVPGHYLINAKNYPGGEEELAATVKKLHDAGILVGAHCFASKISKRDAYVTPVPDKRFWHRFEDALADDVDAKQTELQVAGTLTKWAGSPQTADKYWEGGVQKHREVIIGDEIIQYESIGPEGVWNTFLGCRRGAWGTTARAHKSAAPAVHYGVDGCINGYIIDQETDLLDEAQANLARIFNNCDFDMVYFDGGEDVDRSRFNYYVSNFQANAMRLFKRRPIIHMGTCMRHRLWHSFARSSTVDTYLNTLGGAIIGGKPPKEWPTVRQHINRSVRYMLSVKRDMMPGELGWFGIWPSGTRHGREVDGLQLDELEYLMCKSLAHDCPVSLQTSFRSMERHHLTPEVLHIFKTYEELRMKRAIPETELAPLREVDQDFALIQWQGERRFVPVTPVDQVGGIRALRATVGTLDEAAVATLWHAYSEGTLTLDLGTVTPRVIDFDGKPLKSSRKAGRIVLDVNTVRTTLVCPGMSVAALTKALREGTPWSRPPIVIVVKAGDAKRLVGKITLGSKLGVSEPDALGGDVLIGTQASNFSKAHGWYAEYTVEIPRTATYSIWSRHRYPSGSDQSFAFVPAGETVTFRSNQTLGNCGRNDKKWHWAGRGGGLATFPPGARIDMRLEKGPFTFRIYPRECGNAAATNPRLDLILFCDEPAVLPSDEVARKALGQ